MARAGETIENPITGERVVFRKTAQDTNGELLECDLFVKPDGFVAVEHLHPRQEERFRIVVGRMRFMLDGEERFYEAGDVVVIPPGTRHQWWNPSNQELHAIMEFRPALQFESFLQTVFGLARDGKTNATGGPRNLLQAAVLFSDRFVDHLYLARPAVPLQKILFTVLAPLGRAFGYRDHYPEYTEGTV